MKAKPSGRGSSKPTGSRSIRKALPEHLHPLLIFLHTTGIRVSAARAIKWRQIEESAEKMYVRLPGILTKNKQPLLLPHRGACGFVAWSQGRARSSTERTCGGSGTRLESLWAIPIF